MFLSLIQRPMPPKQWNCTFPAPLACCTSPSILLSVAAACFWLVVAFKIIDRRPFKAAVYFICVSFSLFNSTPQTMGRCPPMRSLPSAPPLYHPPTASADYLVDCCLKSPTGSHLKPEPGASLYFFMCPIPTLQLTELSTARAH
jgi:hypothetical protein